MFKFILTAFAIMLFSIATYSQQVGKASWYGGHHHGKRTASGQVFNMNALTAASNSHPMGTILKVTNVKNNKSVIVKVNDTGGFKKYGRLLDLSQGAFSKIANVSQGIATIMVEVIKE